MKRDKGLSISRQDIIKIGLYEAAKLKLNKFKASMKWCINFIRRNDLSNRAVTHKPQQPDAIDE